jgi:3-polyprenyl-4-hydroxybenzoate decarboxylase
LYAGHAQRAGLIASQWSKDAGGYTVVVDEDIDPLNLEEVIWAVATRAQPERSIQILPYCRTGSPDPRLPLAEKKKYKTTPKPLMASRVVINACQPYEHKSEWYPVSRMSSELRQKTFDKWENLLKELL